MKIQYKWGLVGLLWIVCVCNYADRQALSSVFPQLKTQLNLSEIQLGLIASSFMWVYAISGPLAGWLADKLSPRNIVIGALVFWSLTTGGTGLAKGYHSLVAFRALSGFGEAFYFPAAMALIGTYHGTETRSRAMAAHQSAVYAGTIAGGTVAAYVAEEHGWRSSFFMLAAFGVCLGLVLVMALRKSTRPPSAVGKGLLDFAGDVSRLFQNAHAVRMICVFIGANFVAVVFLTWLPTLLVSKFHLRLGSAGLTSTAYLQIASVIGVLAGGFLGDGVARRWTKGRQKTQALGLSVGVPFLVLIGLTNSLPTFILCMIGFGFCKGVYDANLWASLYDVVAVEQRGIAAGTMNSLGWLGGGLAPLTVAVGASRFGLAACFSATAIVYALVAFLLWRGSRESSSGRTPKEAHA